MAFLLDSLNNAFEKLDIKSETENPEKTWRRLKNECVKNKVVPLPLNTPLNPDKVNCFIYYV